jgi:hypothetical protein
MRLATGTRPSGWLMGPALQASVGTRLWDLAVGLGRQIYRGTRLPGQTWLMGPTRQASVRTYPWDPLLESTSGTQLSGWLVGSGYQAEIY